MIVTNFRTFKIKVLVFILSNLLSIRDLVDTQQLNIPKIIITNYCSIFNNKLKKCLNKLFSYQYRYERSFYV